MVVEQQKTIVRPVTLVFKVGFTGSMLISFEHSKCLRLSTKVNWDQFLQEDKGTRHRRIVAPN